MGFHLGHMWPQEVAFEARSSSDKNEVSISFVQMNFCGVRKRFQFDKKFFDCVYFCEKTLIKSLQMFLEGLETLALKVTFFKSQTLFSADYGPNPFLRHKNSYFWLFQILFI